MSALTPEQVERLAEALHDQHRTDIPWVGTQGDDFPVSECFNCQRYARYAIRIIAVTTPRVVPRPVPHRFPTPPRVARFEWFPRFPLPVGGTTQHDRFPRVVPGTTHHTTTTHPEDHPMTTPEQHRANPELVITIIGNDGVRWACRTCDETVYERDGVWRHFRSELDIEEAPAACVCGAPEPCASRCETHVVDLHGYPCEACQADWRRAHPEKAAEVARLARRTR